MSEKFRPPHIYDNLVLDRASLLRLDDDWLRARRADPESLVIALSGLNVHVDQSEGEPRLKLESVGALGVELDDGAVFLGLIDERPVFAADLADHPAKPGEAVELRSVGKFMNRGEAGMLAYARALAHWHQGHRFCGACGHPASVTHGGHARQCSECGRMVFPRTDPAVIVLVTHENHCLLGRSPRFPENMYSTLAGFVEPGESLEHCLRREIFEEAGVELVDWQYRSSQPWPFPQSLMLGFRATAKDMSLNIDQDELEDAKWIERSILADPDKRPVSLPNEDSIARALIEDWLAEGWESP
jgi:NAD+ diphosphatase